MTASARTTAPAPRERERERERERVEYYDRDGPPPTLFIDSTPSRERQRVVHGDVLG